MKKKQPLALLCLWATERKANVLQESHTAFIRACIRRDLNLHTEDLVRLRSWELREDRLINDTDGVATATIELGRKTTEVTDAREDVRHQTIEEGVHMLATECDAHADHHVLSDVEVADGESGLTDRWLLTCDRRDGLCNELLNVLAGVLLLAQTNVDDHFRHARECVDVRDLELALESVCNVGLEPLLKGDVLRHGERL